MGDARVEAELVLNLESVRPLQKRTVLGQKRPIQ